MIKKTIKYEDYNGNEHEEDFYFSLTKLEVMEMELEHEGGLSAYIEQLTETTAGREAYDLFKSIILRSYGKKSPDGRFFHKIDPEKGYRYADEFVASPAMAELIFGFLQKSEDAALFVRGLLPEKLVAEVEAEAAKKKDDNPAIAPKPDSTEKKAEDYTREELLSMPKEEFDRLAGTDPIKMSPDVLQIAFQRKSGGKS